MANLIRIQYEPLDEGLTKEQFAEFSNKAASAHGKSYAIAIMRAFENWLSPRGSRLTRQGGKNPIGASGAASKNFTVAETKRKGVSIWYVREGGGTPANQYIRKGIPPGVDVSLEKLKLWAARKGITFLSSAEYKLKSGGKELAGGRKWTYGKAVKVAAYDSKSAKGDTFRVKEHGKAEKDKKNVINSALKAIQNALFLEGTDRPGANWIRYHPTGDGRFDYPSYLVTERGNLIKDMNSKFGHSLAAAMVSYWNSSGNVRVFDYKLGKTRKPTRGVIF